MNHIREFSQDWRNGFQQIEQFLSAWVPATCRIHHVGSTSVPEMPAKDIIDVDVECPEGSLQQVIGDLAEAGYDHEGDLGVPGREAFIARATSDACQLPAHHLYACESDSPALRNHLAFRDYLIACPERAGWLAAQKRQHDQASDTRADYIDAKTAAYELIVTEALTWWEKSMHGVAADP